MCILIVKKKDARKMTEQEIRNSASNNPDGFGIAYAKSGKLYVEKTFNVNRIIDINDAIPDNVPVLYHFRIATHGKVNENNCHPFIDKEQGIAFAHNGILNIDNDKTKDWTDSETAFRYLFIPLLKVMSIESKEFECAVNTIIGWSKFAFLNKNGDIKTFGSFIDDEGLLFSNTSYMYSKQDLFGGLKDYQCKTENNYDIEVDDCYNYMYHSINVSDYIDGDGQFHISDKDREEFINEFECLYKYDYPSLQTDDFYIILDMVLQDLKVCV